MPTKIRQTINRHFFRPAWYSILANPYFIVRRGLLKKITDFANQDFSNKKILDVGCGVKPYEQLFNTPSYTGIDINNGSHINRDKLPDKFYNGIEIPFPDNCFDAIICTEVMEHVAEPEKLLNEIRRVLKTDGEIYLSVPFVWNEHEAPFDFQRFSRYGLQQLFAKSHLSIIKLEETSGVFKVCGQLISAFIFERLFPRYRPLKLLAAIMLCFPVQAIFIILDLIFKNSWLTLNYCVVAKKNI